MGRRSRKRAREPAERRAAPRPKRPAGPSRSELKDAEARAALEPLREGERPTAVTVGACVAAISAVAQVVTYAAGLEIGDERPTFVGPLLLALLLLVMAWGMWKALYWAVLGMQALLGLSIVSLSMALMLFARDVRTVAIEVVLIAGCGTLFWFLIKAMARIQMPERRA